MGTKSDFAQKLLHDLRRRKEQMADAQYTGNSHSTSRGNNPMLSFLLRFSFDEPCKNSYSNQETVKTEMKQQHLAVGYQQETVNQNEKQPNLVTHKRSSSCTDFAAHQSTNVELKNQSKGRLSSVIAKLMGLDELPKIADAKAFRREPTSKRKEGGLSKEIENSKNVKPTQETKIALGHKMESVEIEHKTFDRILLNNQEKPKDIIEENNQANRKEQHLSKQKFQVNKHKGRQAEPTISQAVRNKVSIKNTGNSIMPIGGIENRNMNQNALPKKLASRSLEGVGTRTPVKKKPIKVPSAEKKENYFQIHRKGSSRKIDGSSRRGTPQNMERSLGKQSAIFKATKKPSHDMAKHTGTEGKLSQEKSEEANQNITKIHKLEPLNSAQEFSSRIPISNGNESLTEPEKRLKELLVTSQLFLNTIEALFKLNIPIRILETNDPTFSKNSEFKLKIHCSYEIVKRKARRQKLLNHPYARISIGCIKVRSLDDLIKQLCKGFDVLSCYGSRGSENRHSTAADYLHAILEKDIQNRHPDLNSTWDFGWDTMMSTPQEKDEILRDVEKNLLNGLLDEITTDLLQITASV